MNPQRKRMVKPIVTAFSVALLVAALGGITTDIGAVVLRSKQAVLAAPGLVVWACVDADFRSRRRLRCSCLAPGINAVATSKNSRSLCIQYIVQHALEPAVFQDAPP